MALFGGIFRRIASSILEIDDTSVPYAQLEMLNDFLSKYHFDLSGDDVASILENLKRKHLVDSISILERDGNLIMSSEGDGNSEVSSANELLRYVDAELATPESVLIKSSSGWLMLFPFNGKSYVVRAQASLSNIELRALAREIEKFALKYKRIKNGK